MVVEVVELERLCIPVVKPDVLRHLNHIERADMPVIEPGVQLVAVNHVDVARPLLIVVVGGLAPLVFRSGLLAERGVRNADET